MKPPPRLLDDPQVASELRADLKRTAALAPAYDVAAGLTSLKAAIGVPLTPPIGTAVQAAQTKAAAHAATAKGALLLGSASAKVTALAVGSAAIVAAAALGWSQLAAVPKHAPVPAHLAPAQRTQPSPLVPSSEPPTREPLAPKMAEAPAIAAPQQTTDTPTRHAPSAASPAHRVHAAKVPAGLAPQDPDEALRLEVAQLGQIKALVDSDPAQAYRLAEAGHKAFGAGMLRPEREALATLALSNMGRRAEARARATAFLTRYPTSPLRARLLKLLEAP